MCCSLIFEVGPWFLPLLEMSYLMAPFFVTAVSLCLDLHSLSVTELSLFIIQELYQDNTRASTDIAKCNNSLRDASGISKYICDRQANIFGLK